jgi:hypothetical protein
MAKRQRDYQKEYARRVALGRLRGVSRSTARGHPRAGERTKRTAKQAFDPSSREELALKMMRKGASLRDAASQSRMSQERLRAYLRENAEARRENGKWNILDRRARQFPFYSNARLVTPWMSLEQTSEAGRFMQSVKQFLRTGDEAILLPFVGKGVRDTNAKFHPFETDENTLYELDHRGEVVIPEQYRIGNRSMS